MEQSNESYSCIESVFYAIKHFHNVSGQADPTESSIMSYVMDAANRTCSRPINKKKPLQPDHIRSIHKSLTDKGMSLLDRRNFSMMTLCFSGSLRYEEVAKLKLGDIIFCDAYFKACVEKSKTDQCRLGAWVFIAKSESEVCPVKALKEYVDMAGVREPEEYLFRALTYFKTKGLHQLRKKNTPISYTSVRSYVLEYAKSVGLNKKFVWNT